MFRRALAILAFSLALATTGCGHADSSGASSMTGAKVDAAVNSSGMKSAHFTADGFIASGAAKYAFTGDGDMQATPVSAMRLNLDLQTYTYLGAVTFHIIDIGRRTYTQIGAGAWTSSPDTTTFPPGTPTDYIGEETRAGVKVWHTETVSDGHVADEWVRESDGYIVYMTFTDAGGNTFDLLFVSYNDSPVIAAP
jgi:hypothetical protein